jgi:phospholipase D1/2
MTQAPPWLEVGTTCMAVDEARSSVLIDANAYYRSVADAMERAESFILVTAWQLDTRVVLRRDEGEAPADHTLHAVLQRACRRSPELVVLLLPWDWSFVYATDREWATRERLEEIAPGRVRCLWDGHHPPGASQHEKMVLIDGHTAFVGGIDLCDDRWDERLHLPQDPRRENLRGRRRGPYHDVQCVVRGPVVRHLVSLFEDRWERAGGEPVSLRPLPLPARPSPLSHAIALPMRSVGVARTRPRDPLDGRAPIRELEAMSVRAIERAEHLIYVETQYLTAHCIVDALLRRMRSASRGALEIVLMLPRCTEGALERAAIAAPQALALRVLGQAAAARGHAVAAFCSCALPTRDRPDDDTPVTYIHSKLAMIDDVFLTIGSANMTNRSMRLDSELNLAWVAEGPAERQSLRKLRASLLAEHTGLSDEAAMSLLERGHRVMPRLVQLANMSESRLIGHTSSSLRDELGPLDEILVELGDPTDG